MRGSTRIFIHEGGFNYLKDNYGYKQKPFELPYVSTWRDIIDYGYKPRYGWKDLAATKTGLTVSTGLHTPGIDIEAIISDIYYNNVPNYGRSFTMAGITQNADNRLDIYLFESCVIYSMPAGVPGSARSGGGMATYPMMFYSHGKSKFIKGV